MTIGLERLRLRTHSVVHDVGALVIAALTLAAIVLGLGMIENPFFTGEPVGGRFVNLILLGYGLPAVLTAILALVSRGVRPKEYSAIAAVTAVALALVYLSLEVRTLYHGEVLNDGPTTDAEQYTYSAVWLAFGVTLLVVGMLLRSQAVRLASAAVVILTVLKVFLIDMSDLTGIYQSLSFIGLGIVLLGIGWLYQRLLFPRRAAACRLRRRKHRKRLPTWCWATAHSRLAFATENMLDLESSLAIAQAADGCGHMLSWDDFRYVKAIAEARSLAGAAEQLGVNHSTVFRRLAQIEQQLGSRLFERGRAGYALTACGEQMVELAERMGEDIISFERRVTGQDLRPSGELRVTTSDVLLLHLLSDVLVGFRRAYPEIVLDIVVSNQRLNLTKRDADVAVRATYHNPDPLAGTKVARIAWAVFGAAALAGEPFDPARDARRHDWIAFADATSIAQSGEVAQGKRGREAHRLQDQYHDRPRARRRRAAPGWRCCRATSARRCPGSRSSARRCLSSKASFGCSRIRTCATPRACAPSSTSAPTRSRAGARSSKVRTPLGSRGAAEMGKDKTRCAAGATSWNLP